MSAIGSAPATNNLAEKLVASLRPLVDRLGPLQRGCFCERTQLGYGDGSRRCMSCLVENARGVIAEYDAEVEA